jgi:hypothetical protein
VNIGLTEFVCIPHKENYSIEHRRRCTYDVTLWRVRLTIVGVETQQRVPCSVELHDAMLYAAL